MTYDFMFFRLQRAPSARAWAGFAIDQIAAHGPAPALVGGQQPGWRKAPQGREPWIEAIAASRNRSVQAGGPPGSRDPLDGWGIYCANPVDGDVTLCRRRDPATRPSGLASLRDWFVASTKTLAAIAEVRYGFGYSGRYPKDMYFGMGMSAGAPSPELAPLFADPEKVARWFRACAWKTDSAYARDAFPVNALGRDFLEGGTTTQGVPLAQALVKFGGLEQVTPKLHVWSIASEERRLAASAFLAREQLAVVSHAEGRHSQVRPGGG